MNRFPFPEAEIISKKIVQFRNGLMFEKEDEIVTEFHFQLKLQCEFLASFACSPSHIDELISGYLLSSSVVTPENKLLAIEYNLKQHIADVTLENNDILKSDEFQLMRPQGCGGGSQTIRALPLKKVTNNHVILKSSQVSNLIKQLQHLSETHKQTGGNHSAAIAYGDQILFFREDIGRHNAIDKVIGAAYVNSKNLDELILVTSGRLSSEIALKAAHSKIPVVISRSAPTAQAIQIAEASNITFIGFARNNNFNIYCGAHRIQA